MNSQSIEDTADCNHGKSAEVHPLLMWEFIQTNKSTVSSETQQIYLIVK
jgi:hypothetical protein